MKFVKTLIIVLALATTAMAGSLNLSKESFGVLKDTPTYIQEWHIWWGFPYPDTQGFFAHMESTLTSDQVPWRLNWNRNGYPLVGLYDSFNAEVIRWQIRCQKAAGLDASAVMLHPELTEGIMFIQELNNRNMVQRVLDIAAEEDYKVFFMDEVAFRKGVSTDPKVMAKRVIRFLKKYGNHKGFLKINGESVYYFQGYGYDISAKAMEEMFASVDKEVGPVHWILFGSVNKFSEVPQLKSMVDGANIHRRNRESRKWTLDVQSASSIFAKAKAAGKKITDLQYPKFDGTSQPWRQSGVNQYGDGGKFLEKNILNSKKSNFDFVMLSSWNDWEEGANFEPGWDFDGYTDDPYLYCKVIAHLKGKEFVAPPFPAKESLHPTIWEKLNYGDGAGPVIESVKRSHVRGGALTVKATDSFSEVEALEVVWGGDLYWQYPNQGKLKLTNKSSVKGERVVNLYEYSAGMGLKNDNSSLSFDAPELKKYSKDFHVGVATNFNNENPLAPVSFTFTNKTPVTLNEPMNGVRALYTMNLAPYVRPSQLKSEFWEGWRTNVGRVPREVSFEKTPLLLSAVNQTVGIVSLLGDVKQERVINNGKAVDAKGLQKEFYINLPAEVLDNPGAHFLWLRAKDKAGNWGSPILYAVPNYELFNRQSKEVKAEAPLDIPGAIIADNGSNTKGWKGEPTLNHTSIKAQEQKLVNQCLQLANGMIYRTFPAITDGAFSLKFSAVHLEWQRKMIVWITNESMTKGYGVAWNSATEHNNKGTGVVSIVKLDESSRINWNVNGKDLKSKTSGHYALSDTLADFELKRDASGKMTLMLDGKEILSVTDSSFSEFNTLIIRTNKSQLVDNVILTK